MIETTKNVTLTEDEIAEIIFALTYKIIDFEDEHDDRLNLAIFKMKNLVKKLDSIC